MSKSKSYKCAAFRLKTERSESGRLGIWLDLWGNSYYPAAFTPFEARRLAKQFKKAANWLETVGAETVVK